MVFGGIFVSCLHCSAGEDLEFPYGEQQKIEKDNLIYLFLPKQFDLRVEINW